MNSRIFTLICCSSSAFAMAQSYNLNTVVTQSNQDKIIREMLDTFKKGTLDPNTPVTLSGNFSVNAQNRLTEVNIEKAGFKVLNVPLIGTYQTEVSIKAAISDDYCKNISVSYTKVIKGSPSFVNPIFAADLKKSAGKVIDILIKNSDLNNYCAKETYTVIFN